MDNLKAHKIKEIDRGLGKIAFLSFIMLLFLWVIPDSLLGNKEDDPLFDLRTILMIILAFLEIISYLFHLRCTRILSRLTKE